MSYIIPICTDVDMEVLRMSELPHTEAAIRSLGTNDEERGKRLGVSGRTIRRWLNQRRFPDGWLFLKQNPILAESFCKDIRPPDQPSS
jgi:hypothetical protein